MNYMLAIEIAELFLGFLIKPSNLIIHLSKSNLATTIKLVNSLHQLSASAISSRQRFPPNTGKLILARTN
jgi:hypothetical protein